MKNTLKVFSTRNRERPEAVLRCRKAGRRCARVQRFAGGRRQEGVDRSRRLRRVGSHLRGLKIKKDFVRNF